MSKAFFSPESITSLPHLATATIGCLCKLRNFHPLLIAPPKKNEGKKYEVQKQLNKTQGTNFSHPPRLCPSLFDAFEWNFSPSATDSHRGSEFSSMTLFFAEFNYIARLIYMTACICIRAAECLTLNLTFAHECPL
ncbi:hypothetical protein CEXT_797041 [Caerostris extrusa]|uniref:Uncharacterized protein n=1 Tax=Caerostris extrusa TaxID=172846 RepID=A0AAV4QDW6_CAEEX|nr:hypothetical protein CEXT_797041 [Caerostris extrusa]